MRPLRKIGRTRYAVRNAVQRTRRGFSTEDTFSFDGYLAGVIAGGARELQRRDLGCPGALLPALPNGNPDDSRDGMDLGMREWKSILERIATGFEKYATSDDWDDVEVQEAIQLFGRWMPCLWD